jgi:hypothetical protein
MSFIKRYSSHSLILAILLVALTAILTYGTSFTRLGFYYDDWYMLWSGASRGADSLIPLFSLDRPFMGVVYTGFYRLFGDAPLGWHWLALFFRIAGAMAFYWILNLVWPKQNKNLYVLAAALFVVFPGFLAQPHAATKINHLLGYGAALFSIAFSLRAARAAHRRERWVAIALAMLFEALYLWFYEYMIGLEVMRAVLLFWVLGGERGDKIFPTVKRIMVRYLPYLGVIALFMFWRVFIFDSTRSATSMGGLARTYLAQPVDMVLRLGFQGFKDFLSVTLFAWFVQAHRLIAQASPVQLILAVLAAAGAVLLALGTLRLSGESKNGADESRAPLSMICIGALISLGAVFPVVFSNRMLDLTDAYKGYGLHPSAGVVMLLLGFLLWLKPGLRMTLLLGLLALSVTTQTLNIQRWAAFWEVQKNFWWQVSWRAPDITDYTLVMAYAPDGYSFQQDYEMWGPLNLIYRRRAEPWPLIQAQVLNAETSVEIFKQSYVEEPRVRDIYVPRWYRDVLLFSQPTTRSCVHAIDGQMPAYSGSERLIVEKVGGYSEIDRINPSAAPSVPPVALFGPEPEHTWCYIYQQAALARQSGDWARIGDLYDQSVSAGYQAGDPSEYFVFIEGLTNLNREPEAIALTEAKIEQKSALQFSLCESIASAPEYPAEFGYRKEQIFRTVCDSLDR